MFLDYSATWLHIAGMWYVVLLASLTQMCSKY